MVDDQYWTGWDGTGRDGQTDGRTDGRDGRTEGRADERTFGRTDGRAHGASVNSIAAAYTGNDTNDLKNIQIQAIKLYLPVKGVPRASKGPTLQ